MNHYKDGFSLYKGLIALCIVFAIATVFPIVIDTLPDKYKVQNDCSDTNTYLFENLYSEYLFSNAVNARITEPIILDLIGQGVSATSLKDGIFFDFNNDGFAEKIAWASDGNAVLCVDLNNNEKIDDGSEVINGASLISFDINNDGLLDENDEIFSKLKLMKKNGNLLSMSKASVKSIDIHTNPCDVIDENGNNKFAYGSYTQNNGRVYEFGEYNLITDYSNSKDKDVLKESKTIAALPNIQNRGTLHSLHQAMQRDDSLKQLVIHFVKEENDMNRVLLVKKITEKWANAELILENSRGKYVNAKHLAIVEAFMGTKFFSMDNNSSNPNIKASHLIEQLYVNLENYVYAELMKQTHIADLYKSIDIKKSKYDLTKVVTKLDKEIKKDAQQGKNRAYYFSKMVKGLGIDNQSNFLDPKDENCFYLKFTKQDRDFKYQIDSIAKIPLDMSSARIIDKEIMGTAAGDSFKVQNRNDECMHVRLSEGDDVIFGDDETNVFIGCLGKDILDGGKGNDILFANQEADLIFGGDGDDKIYAGEGNDTIFGGNGNDIIYPDNDSETKYSDGNDIIIGGQGNDTIYSYLGNDTYIFNVGDGQDTIYDKQGNDTLYFGKGISWKDIEFIQSSNDMIIQIKNTNDQIIVKDWFINNQTDTKTNINNKVETFELSDGTKYSTKNIKLKN